MAVLGAILLLANVTFPGLVAYAQVASPTTELVYDLIYNADSYAALYANDAAALTVLNAYNTGEWQEKFPWIVIKAPEEWLTGTIKFEYSGEGDQIYTGNDAKAPFGKT